MIIFAYGECSERREAIFWSNHMGRYALRLPMVSAGFGFVAFILATTQSYILGFRRGKGDDFALCAAFCYSAIPFTALAMLKVHHGLQAVNNQKKMLKKLGPLEYEDIDTLFEEYVRSDHKRHSLTKTSTSSHLDVDLEDFLDFCAERKITRDGMERGGQLRGLRRAYAENLVQALWRSPHRRLVLSRLQSASSASCPMLQVLRASKSKTQTHPWWSCDILL